MSKTNVGILQCGHSAEYVIERHGNYDAWFHTLFADETDLSFTNWAVVDMEFPESVRDADAWLLTGSPFGAYEDHAFIPPLEQFIRDIASAKIPMLGICFGHQIIAQALGGRVEKFQGGWKLGRQDYQIEGFGSASLNAWHQDQVLDAPEGAEVIAQAEGCAIAGLRMDDHVLTLQPHPEISNPLLSDLITARRGTGSYRDEDMDRAQSDTALPVDSLTVSQWMAHFLRGTV
ncbi:MAG: type 1 glutamine amidotransferase [Pseudomonadota bacterium]